MLPFSDYKKGFGGKFGVQSDRKDKSAAGWEEDRQELQKHESQSGTPVSLNDQAKTLVLRCPSL